MRQPAKQMLHPFNREKLAEIRRLYFLDNSPKMISDKTKIQQDHIELALEEMSRTGLMKPDVVSKDVNKMYKIALVKVKNYVLESVAIATKNFLEYISEEEEVMIGDKLVKRKKNIIKASDIVALTTALQHLEKVEQEKLQPDPSNVNLTKNTIVATGMTLKEARTVIDNDPVMAKAIDAQYDKLEDTQKKVEDELMEGFGDGNS